MKDFWKLKGRLGNELFQFAALYTFAKDLGVDFYFQDPKWFDKYAEEIKSLYSAGIDKIDMVSIHVRRGDYVDNPFYWDLMETDYYERAMAQFPNALFLVFSDDIKWCKRQSIFRDCEFSVGKTAEEDLNLMASCEGHIIANSSLSWWGGFLGRGKVVYPLKWYRDGINRTKCLESWIGL